MFRTVFSVRKSCLIFFLRRYQHKINVAVVGSGPAGFYTTHYLLKNPNINVDIYEKYPVPFGLIRFGVAPDHPEVKNVINSFTATGLNDRVAFWGNIGIGTDVTLQQLRNAYNVVVLCYGSAKDKTLDIEGEQLTNVLAARRFVGWYNGVPEDADLSVNLDVENVVIIGQGNVALDCARILLSPVESHLQKTDITSHAIEKLKNSRVKRIFVVGRRGVPQVSFTIKEFREITKLNDCQTIVPKADCSYITPTILENFQRPRKRLTELIIKIANQQSMEQRKQCIFKFLRSPLKIIGNNKNSVQSVLFGVNNLIDGHKQDARVTQTNEVEEIECGLVLRSIGYKTISIDPILPMDERRGIIKNENGRIVACGKGLYCSGWAATGATGVILSTMNSSFAIAKNILDDIDNDEQLRCSKSGSEEILQLLKQSNVEYVKFSDWQKIDSLEKTLGMKSGKPREKLVSSKSILKALKSELESDNTQL